jgi:hypothetical protein
VRQLANACQQHLEAQGHFPTGGWGQEWGGDADAGFGSKQPGGWHYSLLPYIDQNALRNDGQGQNDAGKRAAAKRLYETHVTSFVCPTRGVSSPVAVGSFSYLNIDAPTVAGRSDYAANGGDVVSAAMVDHPGSASTTEQDVLAMPGSAAGSVAGGDRATGVVFRGSVMRAAHLRDGLSNVYLLGERFIPRNHAFTSSATGNRHSWLVGFDDDSIRFTAALPSGDGDDAGAGGEVDHPLAGDEVRIVEDVAREGLPARPGEGPERRRQADTVQFLLGQPPDRRDLVGQVQHQLGRVRRRLQAGVLDDEGPAVGDHGGLVDRIGGRGPCPSPKSPPAPCSTPLSARPDTPSPPASAR